MPNPEIRFNSFLSFKSIDRDNEYDEQDDSEEKI